MVSPTQVLESGHLVRLAILETSHLPQPLSVIKQTAHSSSPRHGLCKVEQALPGRNPLQLGTGVMWSQGHLYDGVK